MADNVPLIGPRSRYKIIGLDPTWIYQTPASGVNFNKKLPRTAGLAAPDLDPVVQAGRADFTELTESGIWDRIATAKRAHVVEAIDNNAAATLDIVKLSDLQNTDPIENTPKTRDVPSEFPFTLGVGETIRANGGDNESPIGVLVREKSEAVVG